MARLV